MNKVINKNFIFYSLGRTVSLLGNTIQSVAVPLYILRNTGSGTVMGLYAFAYSMPLIFMMPVGGVIGDRFNRKNTMIITDLLGGTIMLAIYFSFRGNNINMAVLLTAQIILSSLSALFNSTTSAMITEIVDKKNLLKSNSLIGSLDSTAYIAGQVIGAVLYSVSGLKVVFLITGISFIFSVFMEIFIKYSPHFAKGQREKLTFGGAVSDISRGIDFLAGSKGIMYLIIFAEITNFFGWASFSVIITYSFVEGIGFSDKYFGLLEAAITVGILVGNIILSVTSEKYEKDKIITFGLLLQAGVFIVIGIFFFPFFTEILGGAGFNLFIVFFALLIIFGIANAAMKTIIFTNMQLMTPNHMKSRVLSAYTFFMQSIAPFSVMIAGVLLDKLKYYNLFIIYAVMIFITTSVFLKKVPVSSLAPEKKEEAYSFQQQT